MAEALEGQGFAIGYVDKGFTVGASMGNYETIQEESGGGIVGRLVDSVRRLGADHVYTKQGRGKLKVAKGRVNSGQARARTGQARAGPQK